MGFQALDAVAHSVLLTPERLGDIANTCPLRPWGLAETKQRLRDLAVGLSERATPRSGRAVSVRSVALQRSWPSSRAGPARRGAHAASLYRCQASTPPGPRRGLSAAPNVVTPRRSSTARTAVTCRRHRWERRVSGRVGARGRCTSTGAVKTASQARRMSSAVSKRSRASRRRAVRKNSVRPAAYERSNNSGSMVTSASPKPGCPPVIPYSGRRAVAISYSVTATAYRSAATSQTRRIPWPRKGSRYGGVPA